MDVGGGPFRRGGPRGIGQTPATKSSVYETESAIIVPTDHQSFAVADVNRTEPFPRVDRISTSKSHMAPVSSRDRSEEYSPPASICYYGHTAEQPFDVSLGAVESSKTAGDTIE